MPAFDSRRTETAVQAKLDEMMAVNAIGDRTVTTDYYNTSKLAYLDGRKPDSTFMVPGWVPSRSAVVMIAEVKVARHFSAGASTDMTRFF